MRRALGPGQWLISEGDCRSLDPLGLASQCSLGLASWWEGVSPNPVSLAPGPSSLLTAWRDLEAAVAGELARQLPQAGPVSEPALMHVLPQLLPPALPVMLAASSPVRDWQAFAAADAYVKVANEFDIDPVHMALAWCVERPFPTIPIFGATMGSQLDRIIAGLDAIVSDELNAALSKAHRAHPMPY